MSKTANDRLFQQLNAPPPRFELPASYTFSVLLSLLVSGLLVLVYLVVLAGFGWMTISFLLDAAWLIFSGRNLFLGLILGLGGLLAGTIFISLTKPFGIVFGSRDDQITLSREQEPLLYAYVERICETLDTPKPLEIRVELAPNASAGPASLFGGLFMQNPVLSIGLPLALGLNVQQFSGIVAHELGHFSQTGGGTGLTTLLRVVNAGFERIVAEEDWFDRQLRRFSQPRYGLLAHVLLPVRFCNYVGRRFFLLLMLAGDASSSFETRQKEFDADAYETYLAGYQAFRYSSRNLELLIAGYQSAMDDLSDAWQDRRLMDNLPALTVANATRMPIQRQRQLYRLALTRKTNWYDSHPSHAERLQASHRLGFPGIVNDQRPARTLFKGMHRLCRQATVNMLRKRLGKEFTEAKLIPAAQFLREHEETQRAYTSLRHFYLGKFLIWRPLFPFPIASQAPDDPRQVMEDLTNRREAMALHAEGASSHLEELDQLENRLILARQAMAVVEIGYRINPADFELTGGNRDHVQFVVSDLKSTSGRIGKSLEEYDRHARWRLTHALQMIHIRRIYNRLDEKTREADRQTARKLIGLCPALMETQEQLAQLRATIQVVAPLIPCINPKQPDPRLIQNITIQCRNVAKRLGEILKPLTKVAYPFDHAQGHISIAKAITLRHPDPEDPIDVIGATLHVIERFDSLLARVLATMARTAEKVETAMELPKLAQPVEKDEIEEFVRKCEQEAQAPQKWNDMVFATTRWAMQIGITLGLCLVLAVGFLIFTSLPSLEATAEPSPSVATRERATAVRVPAGRSNSQSSPNSLEDLDLQGSSWKPLQSGYDAKLSDKFVLQSSEISPPGRFWKVHYRWQHAEVPQLQVHLRMEHDFQYLRRSRPQVTNQVPDNIQAPIVRVNDVYYVRGPEPKRYRTDWLQLIYAESKAGKRQEYLLAGYDESCLVEIRIEVPSEITVTPRGIYLIGNAFRPNLYSPRELSP